MNLELVKPELILSLGIVLAGVIGLSIYAIRSDQKHKRK